MKRTAFVITLTLGASVVLLGCGQSDEAKAQDYAVEACGITFTDSGPEYDDADGGSTDPYSREFSLLQRDADEAESASTAAAAAAQLDPKWSPLAAATRDISIPEQEAVKLRKLGVTLDDFEQQLDDADRNRHNAGIQAQNVECRALAARLGE